MSEYNTAPTIETVLSAINEGFKSVNARLDRIENHLELVEAKIETLNDHVLTVYGKVRLHEKRISELENRV
jgi:tetrahydromethanopterin S-methyltransferase subunit G